jgi:hypothetical protein
MVDDNEECEFDAFGAEREASEAELRAEADALDKMERERAEKETNEARERLRAAANEFMQTYPEALAVRFLPSVQGDECKHVGCRVRVAFDWNGARLEYEVQTGTVFRSDSGAEVPWDALTDTPGRLLDAGDEWFEPYDHGPDALLVGGDGGNVEFAMQREGGEG